MDSVVFTGFHSIEELLIRKQSKGILYYSRLSKRNSSIIDLAKKHGYRALKVSEAEIAKLAKGTSHRGIVFVGSLEDDKNIKRESGMLYYCGTDKKTGNITVCSAKMSRGGKKKVKKKRTAKRKKVKRKK